jgi:hypothetical protein
VTGDLNTNIGAGAVVDSNNATENVSNNYNSPGAASEIPASPVMSAVAPTMMGGGGNDSCLIPDSTGLQLSIIGVSRGDMRQDPECNRRKDARLLGTPQTVGGLGLQVSGISVMCQDPEVFRAMLLANTPCPILDVDTNRLLIGRDAIEKYRSAPSTFVVGYAQNREFYNALLAIGRPLDELQITTDNRTLSERFRSTSGSGYQQFDRAD